MTKLSQYISLLEDFLQLVLASLATLPWLILSLEPCQSPATVVVKFLATWLECLETGASRDFSVMLQALACNTSPNTMVVHIVYFHMGHMGLHSLPHLETSLAVQNFLWLSFSMFYHLR